MKYHQEDNIPKFVSQSAPGVLTYYMSMWANQLAEKLKCIRHSIGKYECLL